MNETRVPTAFTQALMGQDQPIPEPQYVEYRRQLAARLVRATRREKLARSITLSTCIIAVAGFVLAIVLDRLRMPWVFKEAYFVVVDLAAGCAPLFLILYFLRHRTALGRARHESQTALLLDLERRLEQLRQQRPPR